MRLAALVRALLLALAALAARPGSAAVSTGTLGVHVSLAVPWEEPRLRAR